MKRFHRFSLASLLLTFALCCALPGCATRRQVADIVARSNAALLGGQFGLPNPESASGQPAWRDASERIDTFIAAHPDQPAATSPLRLRQAMLLLGAGQFHLAQAAFNLVSAGDLHTDRDLALKRSERTLLWWFAASTNATWSEADQAQANTALNQLLEEQSRLAPSPEIRDYLAEMRAWIGLAAAKQTTVKARARARLEDALNVYARIFTPDDAAILRSGTEPAATDKTIAADLRRRLRAKSVATEARKLNRDAELDAHPQPPFDALIQP